MFGNGDGTFRPGPSQNMAPYGPSFVAADLNGDGTFQTPVEYLPGNDSEVCFSVVGDFNGDGIPDIATPGLMGVWLFTGKGDGADGPASGSSGSVALIRQ